MKPLPEVEPAGSMVVRPPEVAETATPQKLELHHIFSVYCPWMLLIPPLAVSQ